MKAEVEPTRLAGRKNLRNLSPEMGQSRQLPGRPFYRSRIPAILIGQSCPRSARPAMTKVSIFRPIVRNGAFAILLLVGLATPSFAQPPISDPQSDAELRKRLEPLIPSFRAASRGTASTRSVPPCPFSPTSRRRSRGIPAWRRPWSNSCNGTSRTPRSSPWRYVHLESPNRPRKIWKQ